MATYSPHEAILDFLAASGPQEHAAMVHEVIVQCPDLNTLSKARGAVLRAVFALDAAGLIESEHYEGQMPSFDLTAFGWDCMTQKQTA